MFGCVTPPLARKLNQVINNGGNNMQIEQKNKKLIKTQIAVVLKLMKQLNKEQAKLHHREEETRGINTKNYQ